MSRFSPSPPREGVSSPAETELGLSTSSVRLTKTRADPQCRSSGYSGSFGSCSSSDSSQRSPCSTTCTAEQRERESWLSHTSIPYRARGEERSSDGRARFLLSCSALRCPAPPCAALLCPALSCWNSVGGRERGLLRPRAQLTHSHNLAPSFLYAAGSGRQGRWHSSSGSLARRSSTSQRKTNQTAVWSPSQAPCTTPRSSLQESGASKTSRS